MKNTVNTQEIVITNACTATAIGTSTHGNRKPVLCISTGEVYASLHEAAEHYGMAQSALSYALSHTGVSKGLKFCFVEKTTEHYDELTQKMRDKTTVIMPKQVIKVPVPVTKTTETVALTSQKKYGWFRTYLINMFKKFATALEA